MVVGIRRKSSSQSVGAKLLVIGAEQVGKSATIVRYTTGRFIQNYGGPTNDWIYRHWAGGDSQIELIEQKDIQFCNSGNHLSTSTTSSHLQQTSLAERVALDQQTDQEIQEKRRLLAKLHWANAYIVIYAINDVSTFNKAIKYLNLIANNINSPSMDNNSGANLIGSKLSLMSNSASTLASSANRRRPILLLANKVDLEKSCRQVSASDGRMLAMRHQSMFAEISIADSSKPIEMILAHLIEQIEPDSLNVNPPIPQVQSQPPEQQPTQWLPSIERVVSQSNLCLTAPIWANVVRSQPVIKLAVGQCNRLISPTQLNPGVKLIAPVESAAQTVELVSLKKPMKAYGLIKHLASAAQVTTSARPSGQNLDTTTKPNNYQKRYAHLKSSFRRASMAIVSSKAIAKGSNKASKSIKEVEPVDENDSLNEDLSLSTRTSLDSSELSLEQTRPSTSSGGSSIVSPTSWLKSHIRLSREVQNIPNPVLSVRRESNELIDQQQRLITSAVIKPHESRFRKPLFKYKSRRTTVAFEQIGSDQVVDANKIASSQSDLTSGIHQKLLHRSRVDEISGSYHSSCSSGRSSSSLSNSDTQSSSQLGPAWNPSVYPAIITLNKTVS